MKSLFVRPCRLLPLLFVLALVACKTKSPEVMFRSDTVYISKFHTDTLHLHSSSHTADTISIFRTPDSVYIYHRSVAVLSSDTARSRLRIDTVFRDRVQTVAVPVERSKPWRATGWFFLIAAVALIMLYFWANKPKM